MKRQTGHPDMEALANFRAGLVGGIHGKRIAAHVARCDRCAQLSDQLSDQLSAVTTALASIPAPAMPDAVELRIGAAIAAEAAARRVGSLEPASPARSEANGSTAGDSPRPAPRIAPRRAQGAAGARRRLSRVQILVPAAACLLLAGLGYLLTMPGASGMPSAGSASTPRSALSPGNASTNNRPGYDAISPTSAIGSTGNSGSSSIVFLVTVSTTQYWKVSLRAEVVGQLTAHALAPGASSAPASTSSPGGGVNSPGGQQGTVGASPSDTLTVPSSSLINCVLHLTGDVQPVLVEKAKYEAKPAYVIAVPKRAWVVGLGCTAAKPALITTVALAPGG